MTSMPGNIARPAFMKEIDDASAASWGFRRKYTLGLLAGDDFKKIFRDCDIGSTEDREQTQRHFMGESRSKNAYWPDDQWGYLGVKQEIVRIGFLEAIRIAHGYERADMVAANFKDPSDDNKESGCLIDTVWICAGHYFECCIVEIEPKQRVLHVILTPSFPDIPDDQKPIMTEKGPITVIGHERSIKGYQDYYPERQDPIPPLIPVTDFYDIPKRKTDLEELSLFDKWVEPR